MSYVVHLPSRVHSVYGNVVSLVKSTVVIVHMRVNTLSDSFVSAHSMQTVGRDEVFNTQLFVSSGIERTRVSCNEELSKLVCTFYLNL